MRRIVILVYFVVVMPLMLCAQQTDSFLLKNDSIPFLLAAPVPINQYQQTWSNLLTNNHFLNSAGTPIEMVVKIKKNNPNNAFFYLILGLVFLLALIKVAYARYFSNLFRVFFNTTLRQNQLADQLLQAKLPSLFFNVFFVISGGIYIYILGIQYKLLNEVQHWLLLLFCILLLGLIYVIKYTTLKFAGWITGHSQSTDTYIFIIFLIAKIIGVIVFPFIVLMTFSKGVIAASSALISLLIIGFLILLRFFRSYGLLQNQLKVSRFHFFLYLIGIEIIPL